MPSCHHGESCRCSQRSSWTQQTIDELGFEKSACAAAKANDCKKLKNILSRRPDAIHQDGVNGNSGYTPLHYAARAGRLEAVLLLLEMGAEVNKRTTSGGATSLHRAAFTGHKQIVEALIAHGADGSIQDADGETPAHKAFAQGHEEVGNLLIAGFPESCGLVNRSGKLPKELSKEERL